MLSVRVESLYSAASLLRTHLMQLIDSLSTRNCGIQIADRSDHLRRPTHVEGSLLSEEE